MSRTSAPGGALREQVLKVLLVCCLLPLASSRPGVLQVDDSLRQFSNATKDSCGFHAELRGGTCWCHPCWEGPSCHNYVDYYAPRFLVHTATVVLPVNATGVVYRAWSSDGDLGLTCPLGPGESARCPCADLTYHLLAPWGDGTAFLLDPDTGILTKNPRVPLQGDTTYNYTIRVQGVGIVGRREDLPHDLLDLKIYISSQHQRTIPAT